MTYTDWTKLVDSSIHDKNKLSILEFGLGEGTKYLLDEFKFVYSFELAKNSKFYEQAVQQYSKYKNWEHSLILFSGIGFIDYDPNLPQKLLDDIAELFRKYKFDVVLMDGGWHV